MAPNGSNSNDSAQRQTEGCAYKLADEKGLFLLVQPSGGMLWRMKYRVDGRDEAGLAKRIEKKLSLGTYPEVGLADARECRDAARRLLAQGKDPADEKRREKQAKKVGAINTFGAVAKAYIEKNRRDGLADATIRKREWFVSLVEKPLGARPIAEIAPFEILDAVRPFEAAKNDEKAHRTLQFIGQVFRYAVANQLAPSDPTRDLRGALAGRKPSTTLRFLIPRWRANCFGPLTAMRAILSPASPCSYRRCFSSVRANSGAPNGLKSTLALLCGGLQL